jgi:hypothetical protein
MPPVAFEPDDLQRVYMEVTRDYAYQQFSFLPADGGAQFGNAANDNVIIQPDLIQITTPVDLSAEQVRDKTVVILKKACERLGIKAFIQCGIQVVAHVPAPGAQPSAKVFVSDRLMSGQERVTELGAGFFGGGVKYRRFDEETFKEENLLVEPFVQDDSFIFVSYDVGRAAQEGFRDSAEVGTWIDEAFSFIRQETMSILEV